MTYPNGVVSEYTRHMATPKKYKPALQWQSGDVLGYKLAGLSGKREATPTAKAVHTKRKWTGGKAVRVIKELDRIVLGELVEKITVGEAQVIDGVKNIEITIYYRFVGAVRL